MNFLGKLNLVDSVKKSALTIDVIFYFLIGLLAVLVFSYGALFIKAHFQANQINTLDQMIAGYGSDKQKEQEKEVLLKAKTIEDFSLIISKHKLTTKILEYIEKNTLANVWFSSFAMIQASDSSAQINLSGEAENMEALSKQFNIFERDKENVTNIGAMNSVLSTGGRIKFNFNISLSPKVFGYENSINVPLKPNAKENSVLQSQESVIKTGN